MIEEDLYSHLSTHAGLTALVGTRIYHIKAPQSVQVPYCTYFKVSPGRQYSHQGFSGISRPRMQVSCFADDALEVKQIAEQVTAAIESWPATNVKVQAAFQENEGDTYNDATELYYIPVEFFAWYG